MKKKITIIISMFILALSTNLGTASALKSESEFKTNLEDKEADELFDLKIGDIDSPLDWIKSRSTFSVLEVDESGKEVYWFNVPNLQSIIYNQATQVIPTGYMGSGSYPHERNDRALIKLPKPGKANTAMQRYGFRIPSPVYLGETPRVTMSVMGVLVEDNPITFVANKIKGIFGGSIISAPDTSDYHTLKYISPSDYTPTKNTFEHWAELYWDDVMKKMKGGQVLISGADDDGFKNDVQYVKKTIIGDANLNRLDKGNARKLNNELKVLLGPDYQDVISNIIAFGVEKNVAKSFDQAPSRIMPYDISTLTDIDAKNLISDPRSDKQTEMSIFGFKIKLGLDNMIINNISSMFITFGGSMSELTVFLNGITTFSTIEKLGFDVVALWTSPIMTILAAMIMIALVVMLLGHIVKVLKGEGSIAKVIGDTLMSFLILGVIFSMYLAPDKTYESVKSITGLFLNFGAQTLQYNSTGAALMGNGNPEEVADTAYWIPYFSLWSNYNTDKDLNETSLKINPKNKSKEPEIKDMNMPMLGDTEIRLWNANLAQSFTSGPAINRDAYRTIDHLMAPRLKVGEAPEIFKTSRNENYSNPVQGGFDLGLLILIFIILIGVIVKVILFMEAMYFLVMSPVNLAMSTYGKDKITRTAKEFVAAFVRVGLWDVALSMVIYMTMITSGFLTLLMSVALIIGFVKGIQALSYSNSVLVPQSLKMAKKYL